MVNSSLFKTNEFKLKVVEGALFPSVFFGIQVLSLRTPQFPSLIFFRPKNKGKCYKHPSELLLRFQKCIKMCEKYVNVSECIEKYYKMYIGLCIFLSFSYVIDSEVGCTQK